MVQREASEVGDKRATEQSRLVLGRQRRGKIAKIPVNHARRAQVTCTPPSLPPRLELYITVYSARTAPSEWTRPAGALC